MEGRGFMEEKNKMTPEEIRRYRRRVERRRRERQRVRRNRQILACILGFIAIVIVFLGVGFIKKNWPKKSNSKKAKVENTTKSNETDNLQTTEKSEYKKNDKFDKLDTSGITVCIDPGHGGDDKGHENGDVVESKQMLELAYDEYLKLKKRNMWNKKSRV